MTNRLPSTAILSVLALSLFAGPGCGNGGSGSKSDAGGPPVGATGGAGGLATGAGGTAGGAGSGGSSGTGGASGTGGSTGTGGAIDPGGTGGTSGSGGAGGRGPGGTPGSGGAGGRGPGGAGGIGGPSGGLSFNIEELIYSESLSVTTAGVTKAAVLHNGTTSPVAIASLVVGGTNATTFVLEGAPVLPATIATGGDLSLTVRFRPASAAATTIYGATLTAATAGGTLMAQVGLFGLAMNAANTEPALDQVVRTLGYAMNVGGTTTTLGTSNALIGDEVAAPRFVKAGAGVVGMQPVARYSPFETAPYGYYTGTNPNVTRVLLGAMSQGPADNVANRTLFPPLDAGTVLTFDPGVASFGIYAESAANVASLGADARLYQEEALNNDQAGVLPVHRVRVYPMKNRTAQAAINSYVVVCEEANNSDYQDYVFVLSNVAPSTN